MEENISYEYASMYLLDNPFCIDNVYTYFIPLSMRGEIRRGSFVTVPFGRGNRKQMGVVWSLGHTSEYKDVKTVAEICSDRPALDEGEMALCEYMKENFLCSIGEAVRCVVPTAAIGKMTEFYKAANDSGSRLEGLSPADILVYDYIAAADGRTLDAVKAKFGASAAVESIKVLQSKDLVVKDRVAAGKSRELYEIYYTLAIDNAEAEAMLSGEGKTKLRSEKHKAIIRYLIDSGEETSADEIRRECEVENTQLKALAEKGLINRYEKRVFRDGAGNGEQDSGEIILNDEQNKAYLQIKDKLDTGGASAFLLHGVTGSGKTSVIIKAIDRALECGKGAIMLLPEIALTPQTLKIFNSRYGDKVALIHSGLSAGERFDSYTRLRSGEARLAVGTRSAVFAPVKELGLIVIDEEHETTYKSDSSPRYHTRDIARYRCAKSEAVMLLSSATPSIESYTKAKEGKYTLLELKERYGGATLPEVDIYDMRKEALAGNISPIGARLLNELKEVTDRGEQAILFLNRRGYNTSVSCRSCGEIITCPKCSISMNYHTKRGYENGFLFCHWCGYKKIMPKTCPSCSSEHLVKIGYGTQRIEEQISSLLPDKKIIRMDADSTAAKNSFDSMLSNFKDGKADILLGTQMVTKGHDFPKVTLVGVLQADMSLYMDDYHAAERTFSMLTQVIGRAGRSKNKGVAIIQTTNPDNDTIRLACKQDYEAFYNAEIRLRKALVFPPYCDIALLNLTSADEKQALQGAKRLRESLDRLAAKEFSDVQMIVFGPFESPVYKVDGKYRMRIVVKCRLNKRSRALFADLLTDFSKGSRDQVTLSVDFNPSGL